MGISSCETVTCTDVHAITYLASCSEREFCSGAIRWRMSVALIINDGNWYSNALHNQLASRQPQFRSLDYSIVQKLAFIQGADGIKFVLSLKADGF